MDILAATSSIVDGKGPDEEMGLVGP